ncbi:UDP-glucose dehydrogenase family protein [Pseudalkalibacillus berkeleyi]|uniref:UDP-glucose 6-dehydrogenase n=1 Tax=Pseudalkalibacillus berkeleyi TaxID=1069813 RepID=A0ABS9GVR4_9BACL|nr:UDP-glucose/GDP-mannose dehydrogenase family protein [Pseudalkalibacillus berkeleyi]MCF6136902.1 UDP-glucose/GDP-mannose dehydrogenase family protein [Pseudalkalibacillus berkeleyi]
MNICVIGCGYVGLTTGAMLSKWGHQVTCVDTDDEKIKLLLSGKCPIVEEGLEELIQEQLENKSLHFSNEVIASIQKNAIIFVAVGTPSHDKGETDLSYINSVIDHLQCAINEPKTIIIKSTVPPGTNDYIMQKLIQSGVPTHNCTVISNPEFLREGSALSDLQHPDKVVVGGRNESDLEVILELYKDISSNYIFTSPINAEIIKYASNAFLATKVSFINQMQIICEVYNGDITTVSEALGTDPRIGPHFLKAGLGYGGYCLPKDIQSLSFAAQTKGIQPTLLEAVEQINRNQIGNYVHKIVETLGCIDKKKITIWGLSFKPNTDDCRDSPSLRLIESLQDQGAILTTYDPIANHTIKGTYQCTDIYNSVIDAEMIVVATEWNKFLNVDWLLISKLMKGKHVLDARNCLRKSELEVHGLQYVAIGRN